MTLAWKGLLAAVCAIEAVLLGSGAYAADLPGLVLDPLQGPPGISVSATGTKFCGSCGPVEIDFGAEPVKQVPVAPDGSFQTTFTVPGTAQAGTDAVNAYQQGKLVFQTSFTVAPSSPGPTTTPTPQHTASPAPGPTAGGGSNPGGGASAPPQPTLTPTASAPDPSPAGSNAGTAPLSRATSATSTAILIAALALLVVAVAGVLLYRRLRAKPPS